MSRRRARHGRRTYLVATLVALALVAVAIGGAGTGAFTTGSLDRESSVPVATDENGLLGLDVNDSVRANATDRLVTVTNTLDTPVTVTVSLHADVRDDADLVTADGTVVNETTLELAANERDSLDVRVESTATDGQSLAFDVTATGDGVTVSAPDRSTTITT